MVYHTSYILSASSWHRSWPRQTFVYSTSPCLSIVTCGPGPACRMPPPDLLRWGQGAAVWEGGSATRIVNALSQIEAGSCSSSHRCGGGEGQGKAPWLLGPGPKCRRSSSFSQEWATLSGFMFDRTPALWWTVQKYLKRTPRRQKVCCDDPFSPFQKFSWGMLTATLSTCHCPECYAPKRQCVDHLH